MTKSQTKSQLIEEIRELKNRLEACEKSSSESWSLVEEMKQDRYFLSLLLDTLPDSIYFKDLESRFIRINKFKSKRMGLATPDEAIGKSDFDNFTEEHAQQAYLDEQEIIKTGQPVLGIEERETWPDRPDTWVSTTKMPLRDEDGRIRGTFGISRDITARKLAELQVLASKESLEKAKKETDNILQNVQEGLFLLDAEWKIGTQYSKALETILQQNDLAGQDFSAILTEKIPEKLLNTTRRFLRMMFREDVDESLITDLNPLTQILVNYSDDSGVWTNAKYLSFQFHRIKEKSNKVIRLIATVKDITEEVELAQKLKETEAKTQKQMDWLIGILHVEPVLLQEFIESANRQLVHIDGLLKKQGFENEYRGLLDELFRSVHMIKGNAALFDLKFFAEQAHKFEDRINEIREKETITGADFVPLVLRLSDLRNTLQEMANLQQRLSRFQKDSNYAATGGEDLLVRSLHNLVRQLGISLGKKIRLDTSRFDSKEIPYNYRLATKEILVQLIRNAAFHGLETAAERVLFDKPEEGVIEISTFNDENGFGFRCRDDGRGLAVDALRERAKAFHQLGADEDPTPVADLIFLPGLSTAETAEMAGGRGFGMDIVKKQVESHHGDIRVNTASGQYCEFAITFPVRLETATIKVASGDRVKDGASL